MSVFHISKLDAARRQMETAINLFFYERDAVSIHTLAAAAYEILTNLLKKRESGTRTLREQMFDYVAKESRDLIQKKMREAQNFFKHADKDSETVLRYNPGQAEMLIWESIITYRSLTGERSPILEVFHCWFCLQYPELFKGSENHEELLGAARDEMSTMNKQTFFESVLPMTYRLGKPHGSEV